MLWIMKLSGFLSAAMVMIVLSPSIQSFPPAEAIRSSHFDSYLRPETGSGDRRFSFLQAPMFRNADSCDKISEGFSNSTACDPSLVHIAITLDVEYLRGSIAACHSVLQHSLCPENVFFHFLVSDTDLETLVRAAFPKLRFKVYFFDADRVRGLISSSVRQALEQPLNYARNYLADILEPCVRRVIYLDSDLVVVDDVSKLWRTSLGSRTVGAPEYCHANFSKYFTEKFGPTHPRSPVVTGRKPCYFNTGVMVMDLDRWRRLGTVARSERWMEVRSAGRGERRIYEAGVFADPFLLVFGSDTWRPSTQVK
ncbi:LOW QUALITY PROTEIN: probable galacturonosyltransferase-like 7 [Asparagus officinalis]|uniref:LOW QUALITY PROTEIN: probable galacturonosyltransferase-like 7 n=1 Tax=Asparagus officinalis TaxID=4686 RepID=UPI00098E6701|nr:LOW QUALITY PROTEIN: probable galacturonosyltransferase-like 7 [Asparagus officinalis]